jgi:hypothetical protein
MDQQTLEARLADLNALDQRGGGRWLAGGCR